MNLKRSCMLSLATVICSVSVLNGLPIYSKSKPIIQDEGQAKLMQQINAGQKYKQLTVKEANRLRKDLANVARKKAKMLNKTNRKLTDDNRAEIIGDLNNISNDIHKLELEKRVKSQ